MSVSQTLIDAVKTSLVEHGMLERKLRLPHSVEVEDTPEYPQEQSYREAVSMLQYTSWPDIVTAHLNGFPTFQRPCFIQVGGGIGEEGAAFLAAEFYRQQQGDGSKFVRGIVFNNRIDTNYMHFVRSSRQRRERRLTFSYFPSKEDYGHDVEKMVKSLFDINGFYRKDGDSCLASSILSFYHQTVETECAEGRDIVSLSGRLGTNLRADEVYVLGQELHDEEPYLLATFLLEHMPESAYLSVSDHTTLSEKSKWWNEVRDTFSLSSDDLSNLKEHIMFPYGREHLDYRVARNQRIGELGKLALATALAHMVSGELYWHSGLPGEITSEKESFIIGMQKHNLRGLVYTPTLERCPDDEL